MDSLALLCNLYGDGPATLRRLREAGFATPEALAALEPERLAALLGTSVRAARRFQSEARLLDARLEGVPPPIASAGEPPRDPLLRKVLDVWRERDRAELSAAEAAPPLTPAPSAPAQSEGEPLRAGLLEGLDAAWCGHFARAGVRTLDQLARSEAFALSREIDLPYTRVSRLALLARRQQRERVAARDAGDTLWPRPALPRARAPSSEPSPPAPPADSPFSPAEAPPGSEVPAVERALAGLSSLRLEDAAAPGGAHGDAPLDGAGPFA